MDQERKKNSKTSEFFAIFIGRGTVLIIVGLFLLIAQGCIGAFSEELKGHGKVLDEILKFVEEKESEGTVLFFSAAALGFIVNAFAESLKSVWEESASGVFQGGFQRISESIVSIFIRKIPT